MEQILSFYRVDSILGANSFLLESTPFQKELGVWETKQSQKLSPLYRMEKNVRSVSSPLKTVYCIYPKYSDTSAPYHTCSEIWTSTIYYPMLCLKITGWMADSVDSDEMPHSAVSDLGIHCLLRPVCLNTYGKYIIWILQKCMTQYFLVTNRNVGKCPCIFKKIENYNTCTCSV